MEGLESITRKDGISWAEEAHDILRSVSDLTAKNQKLEEKNQRLKDNLIEVEERLTRCPITDLYNFEFFKKHLTAQLTTASYKENSALIIINIDNMAKIRFSYSDNEVDEVLQNTVYLMKDLQNSDSSMLFRLHGAAFAWYFPETSNEDAMEKAETLRNLVSTSEGYVEKVTLSIGVVFLNETSSLENFQDSPFEATYGLAMQRVKLASTRGYNRVCSSSVAQDFSERPPRVLIIDIDEINVDVLKTKFENLKYEVFTAEDGESALAMAKDELPDAIISEIMLPQKDAFMVRESLLMQSETKGIPFIITSHLKNEDSVERALSLGIEHYFQKPLMLSELIGIIQLKTKGDNYQ